VQTPYSPDLAPSDFWLFGHVKTSLVGKTLDAPEDLLGAVTEFSEEIQPSRREIAFSHWIGSVRWVLKRIETAIILKSIIHRNIAWYTFLSTGATTY
jgi:hypothetical protein